MNLIQATRDGRLEGTVVRVVSDRPDAPVLEGARSLGVPTAVLEPWTAGARLDPAAEERLLGMAVRDRPDVIALCGFMRILRASFLERVDAKVLNVHPSLLPAFPGLDAQRRALEAGATVTGATVHVVDAGVDTGPILVQESLPIRSGETAAELAERLLPLEHRVYVEAIQRIQKEIE